MHKAGQIHSVSKNGDIIVHGLQAVSYNKMIVTAGKNVVGNVKEIFGPVKAPYFSVKPARNARPKIGEEVFY